MSEIFISVVHCRSIESFHTGQGMIIIGVLAEEIVIIKGFVKKLVVVHCSLSVPRLVNHSKSEWKQVASLNVGTDEEEMRWIRRKSSKWEQLILTDRLSNTVDKWCERVYKPMSMLHGTANERRRNSLLLLLAFSPLFLFLATRWPQGCVGHCLPSSMCRRWLFFPRPARRRRRRRRGVVQTMIRCWRNAMFDQEGEEKEERRKNSISHPLWTLVTMVALTRCYFRWTLDDPTLIERNKKCFFLLCHWENENLTGVQSTETREKESKCRNKVSIRKNYLAQVQLLD